MISETAFGFPGVIVEHWTTDQTVAGSSPWNWRNFSGVIVEHWTTDQTVAGSSPCNWRNFSYLRLRQMEGTLNELWYFLKIPMLN